MKKGRFEEKLVEKLGNYETNLDLETAWEALEVRRNKPKRRKLPFLWLLFGVLALGVGTLERNQIQVFKDPQNAPAKYTAGTKTSIVTSSGVLINDSTIKAIVHSKEQASNSKFTTKAQNVKARKTILSNLKSSLTPLVSIKKQQPLAEYTASNNGLSKTSPSQEKTFEKGSTPILAYLDGIQNSISTKSSTLTSLSKLSRRKYSKKQPLWLGLSIGYGKSHRSLEAVDMAQQELVEKQKVAIQALDAYSIRLFAEKDSKSTFFWNAGLLLQQHTNRLTDNFTQISTETRPEQLLEIIRQPDGSEELVYGEGPVSVERTIQNTNYLRYQRLNLSLLAGVHLRLSKPIHLKLAAGPAFVVQMRTSGKTISTLESVGTYVELTDLAYKTSGLWQAQVSAEVNFVLDQSTQLSLGTLGAVDFNSVQQQSSGIEEKYQYLGIQLGLKKRLRKR